MCDTQGTLIVPTLSNRSHEHARSDARRTGDVDQNVRGAVRRRVAATDRSRRVRDAAEWHQKHDPKRGELSVIDVRDVTFVGGPNIGAWPETTKITKVTIG